MHTEHTIPPLTSNVELSGLEFSSAVLAGSLAVRNIVHERAPEGRVGCLLHPGRLHCPIYGSH